MVYAPVKTTVLQIDQAQAKQQLEALGYKPGDNVYMRGFLPSDHPNKAKDYGKKSDKLRYGEVEQWQAEGRGVYFVVNGGGHCNADIKKCRAIFYEHDNLDKELQLNLWKDLGLPEPTVQIDTGGKSIHSYWVFDKPLVVEKWCPLQTDLLEMADADRSIKNPSRVMRLAGAWHLSAKGATQSKIVSCSGKRYSYGELRGVVQVKTPLPTYNNIQVPVPDAVPLEDCLAKASRELLNGVSEGGRNSSGYALACDLIGTANYLDSIGQQFDGDPRLLLDDYANRCNPPLPALEVEGIWKSAQRDNPSPSCGEDGVDNCIRGWYIRSTGKGYSGGIGGKRHRGYGGGSGNGGDGGDGGDGDDGDSKVINFPGHDPLNDSTIREEIDKLIAQGVAGSHLTGALNRLAASSQIYIGELRKQYYQQLNEADVECDRPDNRAEVDNLLNLADQSISLHEYLPDLLADPLTQWCKWLSIRPATVLTALLAGASSLHKVGTELVIHRSQNFRVPSTVYGALVSESGQKKSPIFSNIIRKPLWGLSQEKKDAHAAAMEDYNAAVSAWEEAGKKGEKPVPPPPPTLYYFTNATGEAIPVQASKDPSKALLGLVDELSGLFNSANAYRQGRGSDTQDFLSYFDGTGQNVLRAGGIRTDLKHIYLSLFGTIQPAVLRKHMGDCNDPDGSWARFLFVNQPLEAATLSDDDGQSVQVSDRLAWFYRKIDQLPEMEYRLSHQAFKRYQPVYNQLEQLRVTHPQPGMRAVYSKMEGYIGRLALNLHVLWELANGKEVPDEEIPLFIMELAIGLAQFYMGQVKLIHADSDDEGLAPHITKMIELSKRLEKNGKDGWLAARVMQQAFSSKSKKTSSQQCRDWMTEAEQMGYGQTKGTGNRLKWHWQKSNPDGTPPSTPSTEKVLELLENVGQSSNSLKQPSDNVLSESVGTVGTTPPLCCEVDSLISSNRNDTVQDLTPSLPPKVESHRLISEVEPQETVAELKPLEVEVESPDSLLGGSAPTVPTEALEPIQDNSCATVGAVPTLSNISNNRDEAVQNYPLAEEEVAVYNLPAVETGFDAQEDEACFMPWEEVVEFEPDVQTLDTEEELVEEPQKPVVTPEPEREWQIGDRIIVQTDIPSLKKYNERFGVVEAVGAGTCLIGFGGEDSHHIPYRCLHSGESAAASVPINQ
ncbi:MAG: DUF3987 domain-containing protein [Symploca sp. SIO2G7]|nr:DUF3987 domain-containing protein [Symploca sp. SIO2G7]